jgi:hypothetical protein
MPTPVSNISPGSTTYTHEVALRRPNGQVWGLRLKEGARSMQDSAPQTHAPFSSVKQHSFHLGRGWENFLPSNHMGYWDAKDAWTLTPAKLHPAPLMQWSRGIWNQDIHWLETGVQTERTNIVWKKIGTAGDPYLSVQFTSAGVTATKLQFFIRRIGNPGTLTVEVTENSSGNPTGTVRQSVTVTTSDVTDTTVVIFEGAPSSYAFVAGTVYHVKFRSSDTSKENCWEIGCNPDAAGKRSTDNSTYTATTYSPYFRLAATASGAIYKFLYDTALYAVVGTSVYINGGRGKLTGFTSTIVTDSALNMTADRYINAFIHIFRGTGAGQTRRILDNDATSFATAAWDTVPDSTSEYIIYGTPWFHKVGNTGIDGFTSAAVGSGSVGTLTGPPAIFNNIVYFPNGDSVAIREMQWSPSTKVHDFNLQTATGQQGCASFLETGFHPVDGPQLWRGNNQAATGSGGAMTVSRASAVAWGSPLVFRLPNAAGTTGLYLGDASSRITGMKFHDGTLFVHKTNGLFTVTGDDRVVERKYGAEDMPSFYNGAAMASSESSLYISFWTSLMQLVGGSVVDTKLWLNNLPSTRVGRVAAIEAAFGWIFVAYDAGVDGVSSVLAWNNEYQAFHEILRGYKAGKRIRSVLWQPCEDANPRLWTNIQSELVYQVFPRSPRPLADETIPYQPEFVFESSTMDLLNTNSKYFGSLSMVTKNLSNPGHFVEVDYQTDNDVNSSTWLSAETIVESPEDKSQISAGNKRKIRLRFRGLAKDLTSPPVIENFGLSFFERTEPPQYYTLTCRVGPNQKVKNGGADDHKPSELFKALQEMNKRAEVLTVLSIDPELHNQAVTMYLAPNAEKENYNFLGNWSGSISVYLFREVK